MGPPKREIRPLRAVQKYSDSYCKRIPIFSRRCEWQEEADRANAAARAEAAEKQAQAEVSKALYNEAVSEARLAREECLVLRGESSRSATRIESLLRELESAKERLAESSAVVRYFDQPAAQILVISAD